MADFGVLQALRNDANNLATGGHGGIRHHAHQAYGTAPVDEANTVGGQGAAEILGGLFINGIGTAAGAAENADGTQGHRLLRWLGWQRRLRRHASLAKGGKCPWTERRLIALAQHPAAAEA